MKKLVAFSVVSLLWSPVLFAKKKETHIGFEVVNTQAGTQQRSFTTPGHAGSSVTNCNGNGDVDATTYGNTTTGTVDTTTTCNTTYTPATPPTTYDYSLRENYVHIITEDGSHLTLWCLVQYRKCADLAPGKYEGDIESNGKTIWVYAYETTLTGPGKKYRIKYKLVGSW